MLKAIIVDDELSGRETLSQLIKKLCPEIKVVYLADSAAEGIKAINSYEPDLVLLDVDMPGKNGFDMLEKIKEIDFEIIFVTAYDKYAVQAIKVSALDFLLKPVDEDELVKAIEKAQKKISTGKYDKKHIDTLFTNLQSSNRYPAKIAVPDATGYSFLETSKIVRIEGLENKSYIFLENGSKIHVKKLLKDFEELLGEDFFRPHKSHIVNLKFIKQYVKGDGGTLVMTDGVEIDVSRLRKQELMNKMKVL